MLTATTIWAAFDSIQMTVINDSHMEITFIDFSKDDGKHEIKPGSPVSVDIERPNVKGNLSTLLFAYDTNDLTGVAALPLVKASQEFREYLNIAPEFIVTFYNA